jgi:prepilin-type N-terminal cleavage/methylation domain-containing protein
MNRKGFTLVEVLLTLAILALILVILVPNVFVLVEKNNVKSCENLIKNIESSAKIYVANNKYNLDIMCYDENNSDDTTLKIQIQTLIDSGDLTADSSGKIINPAKKQNAEIPLTNVVNVTYNCSTKEFNYEVTGIDCTND